MNYQEFFNFSFNVPVAVVKGIPANTVIEEMLALQAIPITFIQDPKHPLFKKCAKDFKKNKVKEKIKVIILSIGYHKQFLS